MNKLVFFILIVLLFPTLGADVISLNSGGSNDLVINPDTYIEGFFSCIPYTCSALGYNCGTWSDGCGGTLDCGTCASGYTCTSGICVAEEGGEEGGGGGGEFIPGTNILVIPSWNASEPLRLSVGTTRNETITVKNNGETSATVILTHTFGDYLQILGGNDTLIIPAGQSRIFNIRFIAGSQKASIEGKITIKDKTILTQLDISISLLLFDSNIVVLNKDYLVEQGDKLKTQVTLIPMGDPTRLDVTLNYVIKDYKNKIYLTKSETLLVEKQMNFKRDFDTGILPIGKYIVGLELVYPGGIAPSSAHFEVIEKVPLSFLGKIIYFLIIMILLVLIIIVALLIRRFAKQRKAQRIFSK
jgi:hypothetical protein